MKNIIVATFTLLFIFTFSTELSYSQQVNKPIQSVNINDSHVVPLKLEKENKYIEMQATGYDLSIQSCGKSYSNPYRGITKNGYNLNNKSHSQVMTVSSNKFPMGIKLKLTFPKSHEKYNGLYIVRDTGNFGNNVLDVYLGDFGEKVNQDTIKFGRVDVEVLVVE